jgi:putative flippase GtrA
MHLKVVIRYACYLLAVVLGLFAFWCLLWILSSYSMAFTECANAYELFASNPRCRQPLIAALLAIASLAGVVIATLVGRRFRENQAK